MVPNGVSVALERWFQLAGAQSPNVKIPGSAGALIPWYKTDPLRWSGAKTGLERWIGAKDMLNNEHGALQGRFKPAFSNQIEAPQPRLKAGQKHLVEDPRPKLNC